MRPPARAIQTDGAGPDVVFVHGTGGDRTSWAGLVAVVRDRVRATLYDRRGTIAWPLPVAREAPGVGDHAEDAADVIAGLGSGSAYVCGASFGAVIVLELMKRRPHLVRGAILFEPALSGDDRVPSVPRELAREVNALVERGAPERAAECFWRRVLGDAAWRLMPAPDRATLAERGRQIHQDLRANSAYRAGYGELGGLTMPVLLLQGERSRPVFDRALRALHATLPRAERRVVPGADHFPRGEAWRGFAEVLTAFVGA